MVMSYSAGVRVSCRSLVRLFAMLRALLLLLYAALASGAV